MAQKQAHGEHLKITHDKPLPGTAIVLIILASIFALGVVVYVFIILLKRYRTQDEDEEANFSHPESRSMNNKALNAQPIQSKSASLSSSAYKSYDSTFTPTNDNSPTNSTTVKSQQPPGMRYQPIMHKQQEHLNPINFPCGNTTESGNKHPPSLGHINFSLSYDRKSQLLTVKIIGCGDLKLGPNFVPCNLCIRMQILPERKHFAQTKIIRGSNTATFDELVSFTDIDKFAAREAKLHFAVIVYDRFSREDVLGEVCYPLKCIAEEEAHYKSLLKEIKPKKSLAGASLGEILIGLHYEPKEQRLEVMLWKAKNLPSFDLSGLAGDFHLNICVLYCGQRIAKRRTTTTKKSFNPQINEKFTFQFPESATSDFLENIAIQIYLNHVNRMLPQETVGSVEFSSNTSKENFDKTQEKLHTSATAHWIDTFNHKTNKPQPRWHKLLPLPP